MYNVVLLCVLIKPKFDKFNARNKCKAIYIKIKSKNSYHLFIKSTICYNFTISRRPIKIIQITKILFHTIYRHTKIKWIQIFC